MSSTKLEAGRKKTGGRQKGTPNKTTQTAKQAIALAAEKLGGTDRLAEWAQEDPVNERAFWTQIYPKLMPVQVDGPGPEGEHIIKTITRRIVDASAK
jgi:hypothetical protein